MEFFTLSPDRPRPTLTSQRDLTPTGQRDGPRLLVTVDPTWALYDLWKAPFDNKQYVINYFDPEAGLRLNKGVNWSSSDVIGRAEAYRSFENSDNAEISFDFSLHAAGDTDPDGKKPLDEIIQDEVIRPLRFFESLKEPWRIKRGFQVLSYPPPPVIIVAGSYLTARGFISEFSMAPTGGVVDPVTFKPQFCLCSLSLVVTRKEIPPFHPKDGVLV